MRPIYGSVGLYNISDREFGRLLDLEMDRRLDEHLSELDEDEDDDTAYENWERENREFCERIHKRDK